MKRFVQLYRDLESTTKTNKRIQFLVNYFEESSDEDKLWAIALLTDKRPPKPLQSGVLKTIAAEAAMLPSWLFDETYLVVGDLSETISLLVKQEYEIDDFSLAHWMTEISNLKKKEEEIRIAYVLDAWKGMDVDTKFIFNKLIGGGFRMGVSQQLILKSLAIHTNIPQEVLAHRLMGKWSPNETNFQQLVKSEDQRNDAIPYPFYLAYALEGEVADLGSLQDWVIEKKWDGIRVQIIKRNGEIFIWSRGEELMTAKIPELHFLKDVEKDFVIDGEIICHDGKEVMPFANLQTRIGRKNLTKRALETSPIAFITYDLLELNGADLREVSLDRRREELSLLTSEINSEKLILSEEIKANSWKEIIDIRSDSRQLKCEGLMLKRRSSAYKVGRKKGDWWKWKLDAMTIDAVMIYAMKGHGRRANLYTDFTFAIWHEGLLLPFTKAYSGLTDAEMKEVDAFVKKNTIDKFGPVRSVTPTLVFEIAFEGIQLSSRHKSGIALRFPRIHRWRKDKLANEANTKEDLLALLNQINPS